jgi:hypothetical protein
MSDKISFAYYSMGAARSRTELNENGMLKYCPADDGSGTTVVYVSADKRTFVKPTSVWETKADHDKMNGWEDSTFLGRVFYDSSIGPVWFDTMTEVEKQAQLDRFWDGEKRRL